MFCKHEDSLIFGVKLDLTKKVFFDANVFFYFYLIKFSIIEWTVEDNNLLKTIIIYLRLIKSVEVNNLMKELQGVKGNTFYS